MITSAPAVSPELAVDTADYVVVLTRVDPADSAATDVVNTESLQWPIVRHSRSILSCRFANAVPRAPGDTVAGAFLSNRVRHRVTLGGEQRHAEIVVDTRWRFGQSWQGGGAFVGGCWVDVSSVNVASAFDLDLDVLTWTPLNIGTVEAPVGALPVTISGRLCGVDDALDFSYGFTVLGDGGFEPGSSQAAVATCPKGCPNDSCA